MIRFTVPGSPVGKGRPRAFMAGGAVRMVTPQKTREYESKVNAYARLTGQIAPDGPLAVQVVAVFHRPQRLSRKSDPDGRIWHESTPDVDNCAKAVLDGMNGAIYDDDRRVVWLSAMSCYAARGEDPCVEVTVCPL